MLQENNNNLQLVEIKNSNEEKNKKTDPSFFDIPKEVRAVIAKYLMDKDVANLCQVNKKLRDECASHKYFIPKKFKFIQHTIRENFTLYDTCHLENNQYLIATDKGLYILKKNLEKISDHNIGFLWKNSTSNQIIGARVIQINNKSQNDALICFKNVENTISFNKEIPISEINKNWKDLKILNIVGKQANLLMHFSCTIENQKGYGLLKVNIEEGEISLLLEPLSTNHIIIRNNMLCIRKFGEKPSYFNVYSISKATSKEVKNIEEILPNYKTDRKPIDNLDVVHQAFFPLKKGYIISTTKETNPTIDGMSYISTLRLYNDKSEEQKEAELHDVWVEQFIPLKKDFFAVITKTPKEKQSIFSLEITKLNNQKFFIYNENLKKMAGPINLEEISKDTRRYYEVRNNLFSVIQCNQEKNKFIIEYNFFKTRKEIRTEIDNPTIKESINNIIDDTIEYIGNGIEKITNHFTPKNN